VYTGKTALQEKQCSGYVCASQNTGCCAVVILRFGGFHGREGGGAKKKRKAKKIIGYAPGIWFQAPEV